MNTKKQKSRAKYYTEKFGMKMNGSLPSEAAWWIDGIGNIDTGTKVLIWKNIQKYLDRDSRDRQLEHADLPEWLNEEVFEPLEEKIEYTMALLEDLKRALDRKKRYSRELTPADDEEISKLLLYMEDKVMYHSHR